MKGSKWLAIEVLAAATSGPGKLFPALLSMQAAPSGRARAEKESAALSVFDVDQMRRFAKALSCKVGRSSALVLYPATSQDRCQRGAQGLEELRSKSAKDRSQYANDQTAI